MAKIHLVSHTHWDREWYQTFQQFRLRLVHLVDGLLDLMAADPNFSYFMLDGQTIVLDDYLQLRPERYPELCNHIQSGRILIGPWYVLPDEFLVSPEATIRNLLQGIKDSQRFGARMCVGYLPDPFGHIGQMPQILRGFGIEEACLWRGLSDHPTEFWWQAPDGSRVLMAYLRDSYSNAAGLSPEDPEHFASEVCRLRDSLAPHSTTPPKSTNVLLMYGTDHMEPPAGTTAAIDYANQHLNGDSLALSTLPHYLAEVRSTLGHRLDSLPTVHGELRDCQRSHLLPGVLSTRMWIKQRNQTCQTLLEKWAEPFGAWAELVFDQKTAFLQEISEQGQFPTYHQHSNPERLHHPSQIVNQAWRLLMENHPHDSICGCSIDQVHKEMQGRFDQVEQMGEEITRQSLAALAETIITSDPEISQHFSDSPPNSCIIVFNPTGSSRTDWIQSTIELPPEAESFEIVDDTGQVVPHQEFGTGSRELINVILDRKGLQEGLGMVHAGLMMGMTIRSIQWHHQGNRVGVDVVLSEHGQLDPADWEAGMQTAKRFIDDPEIDSFAVRVRLAPSADVLFVPQDVPGHGYKRYYLCPKKVGAPQPKPIQLNPLIRLSIPAIARLSRIALTTRSLLKRAGSQPPARPKKPSSRPPYLIENEFYQVAVSPQDGSLSLFDRRTGTHYNGLNRFISGGDCGDEYNYCPPERDSLSSDITLQNVQVQRGPVQQWIEVESLLRAPAELNPDRKSRATWKSSLLITTRFTLTHGVPRLDIHTTVDNAARDHRLRVHFPLPFSANQADYDGHFEIVRREVGLPEYDDSWVEQPRPEQPQRGFVSLATSGYGLLLANRGLPEVEVLQRQDGNSEIALTLLRGVGWLSRDDFATRKGNAGPSLETPEAQMQGLYHFDYSLIPFHLEPEDISHQAYWAACHQGWAFNAPLRSTSTSLHTGELPGTGAMLHIDPAEFVISALKISEAQDGWIARGYNPTNQRLQVSLTPWKPFPKAERVMLSEESLAELPVSKNGMVRFTAQPNEIVTVKFRND